MKHTKPEEHAMTFLAKRNPFDDMEQMIYVILLMEYEKVHGPKAIIALAGFYLYAIKKIGGNKASKEILSTFKHDLGGRNDLGFAPRSASYKDFFYMEFYPELLTKEEQEFANYALTQ